MIKKKDGVPLLPINPVKLCHFTSIAMTAFERAIFGRQFVLAARVAEHARFIFTVFINARELYIQPAQLLYTHTKYLNLKQKNNQFKLFIDILYIYQISSLKQKKILYTENNQFKLFIDIFNQISFYIHIPNILPENKNVFTQNNYCMTSV